jgi:hypothetical protein
MKNKQVYSLCEAVADITYIAANENYRTDDSREMISQFIHWAEEFERLHKHIEWGINSFTLFKITQWRSI